MEGRNTQIGSGPRVKHKGRGGGWVGPLQWTHFLYFYYIYKQQMRSFRQIANSAKERKMAGWTGNLCGRMRRMWGRFEVWFGKIYQVGST